MSEITIRRLEASAGDFNPQLDALLAWESVSDADVQQTVATVIDNIRHRGDEALLEYSRQFDRFDVATASALVLDKAAIEAGYHRLPAEQQQALGVAAERVESYHQRQLSESWSYTEIDGTVLGQQVTAMDRVGIYVPGGTAPLASSVIMNAMPAKVAGVREVVMATPAPDGKVNDFVLGAAHVARIDRVFLIGGAQAIAALAFGTETVPAVDKIVGPGNIFVATAKKQVFGKVGIDMIAGPSEILVVCDGKTDPDWIALDLFSQAEHDPDAQAILISHDADYLNSVEAAIQRSPPSTSNCQSKTRMPGCPVFVTPARFFWDATPRKPWVITVRGPITSCRPAVRRASFRRWGFTIFKNAARSLACRPKVLKHWAQWRQYWRVVSC